MTKGKVVQGVFALNKPKGITSAQVVRDLQYHFDPSKLFAPWISIQRGEIERSAPNQRKRRRDKEVHVKVGHGGTLDPLATGVLIAGVGLGTKSLQQFLLCTKTYEAIVVFGAATDTYDRTGKILKKAPYQHITKEMVERALGQYRGKILQTPPLFSALKMNGKPLYEYAREGKPIPREIEQREVTVEGLELLEWYEGGSHDHKLPTDEAGELERRVAEQVWSMSSRVKASPEPFDGDSLALKKRKLEDNQDELVSERPQSKRKNSVSEPDPNAIMSGGLEAPEVSENSLKTEAQDVPIIGPPAVKLRMTVTSGFYVRSLCHDLGAAVGSAANMAELVRTRQGDFELGKNVFEYTDLEKGEEVWGPQIDGMLEGWSAATGPNYQPAVKSVAEDSTAPKDASDAIVKDDGAVTVAEDLKAVENADAIVNEELVKEEVKAEAEEEVKEEEAALAKAIE